MSYIGTEPKDIRSFGRTKFDYTATQGQTAFTGADDDGKVLAFTVEQIEVYVNGILMDDSDFTTTGTGTVTLTSAANLNDVINIVSFETNIPDSNYVPASGGTFTGALTTGALTTGALTTGALTIGGAVNVNNNHVNIDAGYSYQWGDSHERIEQSDGKIEFFTNNGEQMTLSGSDLLIGSDTSVGYGPLQIGSTSRNVTILQMLSSTSGDCGVHFGEGTSGASRYRGYVTYSNSLDEMYFGAGDSTKMRLDGAGRAFINTTYDSSGVLNIDNQYGDYCLGLRDAEHNTAYAVFLNSSNSATGSILRSGISGTSFNTTSDYRLKENIVDISNGIERVKQLAPKRFNFIEDPDRTVDGFLAHEAQAVVAEAVHGTKDELEVWTEKDELPDGVSVGDNKLDDDGNTIPKMQGIDQAKLVPLLTAALQEAIAKIETLETKVAALEGG